ncbi:hypothetical protein D1003_08985 [Riemerella anatipestifer]|nr:hypothetical protein [Riemerella anatipestifer]
MCKHTHRLVTRVRVVYYFLSKFLSSIINNVPPIFVGGVWCLAYAKFCFHKYLLEVHLFHKLNWLFGFKASSVQRGYPILSVLAFLLVLCVFRGGRRFLIGSRVQGLKFKYSRGKGLRFKVQKFKESSELLNYAPRTLNFFTTSQLNNFTT